MVPPVRNVGGAGGLAFHRAMGAAALREAELWDALVVQRAPKHRHGGGQKKRK